MTATANNLLTDRALWDEERERVELFELDARNREFAARTFFLVETEVVEATEAEDFEWVVNLAETRLSAIEIAEEWGVDWRAISAAVREAA